MEINLNLHPRQGKAYQSEATEILYGGAAGGGKSHLLRAVAIALCSEVPGLQVGLFRRLSDDLYKNHMEGSGGFLALLQPWFATGEVKWNGSKNYLAFKNGARIWLCHCQYEKDVIKYQGVEFHVLLIDELTHFTEKIYRFLRSRNRLGGLEVPAHLKGKLPLAISGSNPGGIGHAWVKRSFVDPAEPMEIVRQEPKEGGRLRQFIPAKLSDNPTMLKNDPFYVHTLEGLGDPILVRAMLDGDWNIVAGGAIDDLWRHEKHIIPPFEIPVGWQVFRSFDWGSARPFSVGWWAKANGEEAELPSGGTFCPPANSLIRFAEWYGTLEIGSNEGIRMPSPDVARGIIERERRFIVEGLIQRMPEPGPADSSIYDTDDEGSDSIAKKMAKEGVTWIKADKRPGSRMNGLEMLRTRLKATLDKEGPGIFFSSNCRATIALLPIIPRHEKKIEDVDTDAEDHIYDEVRYTCLSEPVVYAKRINLKFPV